MPVLHSSAVDQHTGGIAAVLAGARPGSAHLLPGEFHHSTCTPSSCISSSAAVIMGAICPSGFGEAREILSELARRMAGRQAQVVEHSGAAPTSHQGRYLDSVLSIEPPRTSPPEVLPHAPASCTSPYDRACDHACAESPAVRCAKLRIARLV
jgi:hypothetical protein